MKVVVHVGQIAPSFVGEGQRVAIAVKQPDCGPVIGCCRKAVGASGTRNERRGQDYAEIFGVGRGSARDVGDGADVKICCRGIGTQRPGFNGKSLIIGR